MKQLNQGILHLQDIGKPINCGQRKSNLVVDGKFRRLEFWGYFQKYVKFKNEEMIFWGLNAWSLESIRLTDQIIKLCKRKFFIRQKRNVIKCKKVLYTRNIKHFYFLILSLIWNKKITISFLYNFLKL